jgi:hypothetical protein
VATGFFLHSAAQSKAAVGPACFIFFLCYGGFRTAEYSMNAMNTAYSSLSTGYEIAGVFARVLRIPGTLACPGCSR